MVHKKFIKKNGKVFGPYLYQNKRVNGKVVTKYLGIAEDNSIVSGADGNSRVAVKNVKVLDKPRTLVRGHFEHPKVQNKPLTSVRGETQGLFDNTNRRLPYLWISFFIGAIILSAFISLITTSLIFNEEIKFSDINIFKGKEVSVLLSPSEFLFKPPTPDNGTIIFTDFAQINVSLIEPDLEGIKFNWNGTNYTAYDSSLVLMMNFDNRSALGENDTHVKDLSNYGNNGTVVGAQWNSSGKYYGAFSFDGLDDYINATRSDAIEGMSEITIAAWINPVGLHGSSASRIGTIVSKNREIGNHDYALWMGSTPPHVNFYIHTSTSTTQMAGPIINGNTGWHYLVATWNGGDGTMSIYLNGEIYFSTTGPTGRINNAGDDLSIGRHLQSIQGGFNGSIDELRIWNRSLSLNEIREQYYSNLYKYDTGKWSLYINQSNLSQGTYYYQAFSLDNTGLTSATETRTLFVSNASSQEISFVPPTPPNGTVTRKISIDINVSINMSNVEGIKFNWDGTNYSFYDDSLVLMMNFDNRSALGENDTFIRDLSRYGNNGTCGGTNCPNLTTGVYGKGLNFERETDYSPQYISIQNSPSINISGEISLSAWVMVSSAQLSTAVDDVILSKGWSSVMDYPWYQYGLEYNTNEGQTFDFIIADSSSQVFSVSTASSVSKDIFHHVVGTYNGTVMRIYIDGVLSNSANFVGSVKPRDTPLRLGVDASLKQLLFGKIDELRIWNRSLSEGEVRELYRTILQRYDKDRWNLLINKFNLPDGVYTYQAFAKNSSIESSTDLRTLIVESTLSNCQLLNEEGVIYSLDGDLITTGTCLNATANNIIIECNGFDIRYADLNTRGYGIFSTANSTIIRNCNVIEQTGTAGMSHAINLQNSYNSKILNTILTTIGSSSDGIFLNDSLNGMFEDLSISAGGSGAHSLDVARGNVGFELRNGVLASNGAGGFDINVNGAVAGGEWNFTNVGFVDKNIVGTGVLNVQWYLDVNVTDSLKRGIGGAVVNISDIFGNSRVVNTMTDGLINQQVLREYNQTNLGQAIFRPYLANVTHPDYASNFKSVDLTQSISVVIALNKSPEIVQYYPVGGERINLQEQDFAYLNFSVNDLENDPMEVWVYGSNDSSRLGDFLLFNKKGISNSNFSYIWKGRPVDPLSNSLVALYHLDNRSALGENDAFVRDLSRYGNNGTCSGTSCPAWNSSGKFAGAFDFDGINDYFIIPDSDSLDISNKIAIVAWIYPKSFSTQKNIVCKGDGDVAYNYCLFLLPSNGHIALGGGNSSSPCAGCTLYEWFDTPNLNQWNHIVLIFDGSKFNLYLNGEDKGEQDYSYLGASASLGPVNSFPLYIGYNSFIEPQFFNGTIDEVAIWNRTLSSTEIEELSNLTFGLYHWRVDAYDKASLSSKKDNFIMTNPPFTKTHIFNSTFGTNTTDENLNCYASAVDSPNATQYITTYWTMLKNSVKFSNGAFDMRTEMQNNSDMIFFFHFNNDSRFGENDTFIYDHSGRGHNAAAVCGSGGNCPKVVSGYFGKAFNFSWILGGSTNHHLRISDSDELSFGTNATITAWIYYVYPGLGNHEILTHKGVSERGYTFGITEDTAAGSGQTGSGFPRNRLRFDYKDSLGGSYAHYSNSTITSNNWHFVSLVREEDRIRFYLDGILDGERQFNAGPDDNLAIINPSSDIWIGDSVETGAIDEEWNGAIEEMAFWNKSLKSEDIYALYLRGKGVGVLREVANVSASSTDNGDNWICSVFMSNQDKNESFASNRSLTIGTLLPGISFVQPTPNNGTTIPNNFAEINISITEKVFPLRDVKFNWNGTNYTIYNDSLVLMMNFDNMPALGEGNTFMRDLSTKANNGSCNAVAGFCPIWSSSGKYNGAFAFEGLKDWIEVPDIPALRYEGGDITMSAWFYADPTENGGLIISKPWNGAGEYNYRIYYDLTGIQFVLMGNIANEDFILAPPVSSNSWHHVAAVANSSREMRIYIDGVLRASKTHSIIDWTPTFYNQYPVLIGSLYPYDPGWEGNLGYGFTGSIDEVRIWNRSLSAGEVQEQYYSNLYKYNQTNWNLFVNQSNLSQGIYYYQGFAEDTAGGKNQTEVRALNVNISLAIIDISNLGFQNINPGNARYVNFSVIVRSGNLQAITNLNASFSRGSIFRANPSCIFNGNIDAITANYSCVVDLWYFDPPGEWNVSANVYDLDGNLAYRNESFVVMSNKYITHNSSISWTSLTPDIVDIFSDNPLLLNNVGNEPSAVGSIKLTAMNLLRGGTGPESIPANNFLVNINGVSCVGDNLIHNTGVIVSNALLPVGNNSLNYGNEASGQEELFICLSQVPVGLPADVYDAKGSNSWQLTFPDVFYNP